MWILWVQGLKMTMLRKLNTTGIADQMNRVFLVLMTVTMVTSMAQDVNIEGSRPKMIWDNLFIYRRYITSNESIMSIPCLNDYNRCAQWSQARPSMWTSWVQGHTRVMITMISKRNYTR